VKRSSLKEAKEKAIEIDSSISRQEAHVLELNGRERDAYKAANALVEPHGVSLVEALTQWTNARRELPGTATITDAVDYYNARYARIAHPLTVNELVERYVPVQEKRGLASETSRKRRYHSTRFAESFGTMPVHRLDSSMMISYFEGLGGAAHSQKTRYKVLSSLFRYAVDHKHAPPELIEELKVAGNHLPKTRRGAVKGLVYTPAEMREILGCVRPALLPETVLIAFCGVRRQEIISRDKPPLDWSQVKLDRGHVDLDDEQAKAEHRRLAPIPANASAWLRQHWRPEGRIAHLSDPNKLSVAIRKDVNDARKAAGKPRDFKWRKNGLRHSFISYRVASIQNVPQVAIEAGNSVEQIHGTYREVRTQEEAEEYFSILPPGGESIVAASA
ncbi:MAG: tyrosine-type recombinase/integrase, partial [Limisphaerales bacterium]